MSSEHADLYPDQSLSSRVYESIEKVPEAGFEIVKYGFIVLGFRYAIAITPEVIEATGSLFAAALAWLITLTGYGLFLYLLIHGVVKIKSRVGVER